MKNSDILTKSELHDIVVPVLAAMDLEQTVRDLRDEVQNIRRSNDCLIEILKAFSDLLLELTDKSAERKFLEHRIMQAEREAARNRLPLWFWRPEEGFSIQQMLKRRAAFLIDEQSTCVDDTWDLLREFVGTVGTTISDEDLSRVIESVHSPMPEGGNA